MSLPKPYVPIETDEATRAFPAHVSDMMPALAYLKEAKREWTDIASHWFGRGLGPDVEFHPAAGIDPEAAFHHIACILHSYEPKHEHKIAAVAILMESWFTRIDNYEAVSEALPDLRS